MKQNQIVSDPLEKVAENVSHYTLDQLDQVIEAHKNAIICAKKQLQIIENDFALLSVIRARRHNEQRISA